MFGQQGSLVKYSTPVLVSASIKTTGNKKTKKGQEEPHHTEDILGQILPPKQHKTDNGQLWVQTVLSTPATKIQVIQLHEQLDKRLLHRQARQIGLCPIREELFEQCFDETIRQITIDCRQRGLLLVRVRDQYRNQIKSYKNLYQSSINHAMRRVIDSDQRKTKMVICSLFRISRQTNYRNSANSYREQFKIQLIILKQPESKRIRSQNNNHRNIKSKSMRLNRITRNQKLRFKMPQRKIVNDISNLFSLLESILNLFIKYIETFMNTYKSSQVIQYPRRKMYLSSLNELIDRRIVVQPEIQTTSKLFPNRNFAKKLSMTHQRVKSSIQLRIQKYDLHMVKTQKQVNMMIENKKKSYPNSQSPIKLISKINIPNTISTQLPTNKISSDNNDRLYATHSHFYEMKNQSQTTRTDSPQRNFLRKGSNLQKQIVINLLRNKLMRQQQNNLKRQYDNNDILKMIQVYKGVDSGEIRTSRKSAYNQKNITNSPQKSFQDLKQIKGWDNEPNEELVEDH